MPDTQNHIRIMAELEDIRTTQLDIQAQLVPAHKDIATFLDQGLTGKKQPDPKGYGVLATNVEYLKALNDRLSFLTKAKEAELWSNDLAELELELLNARRNSMVARDELQVAQNMKITHRRDHGFQPNSPEVLEKTLELNVIYEKAKLTSTLAGNIAARLKDDLENLKTEYNSVCSTFGGVPVRVKYAEPT